jgi:hypothetical protein
MRPPIRARSLSLPLFFWVTPFARDLRGLRDDDDDWSTGGGGSGDPSAKSQGRFAADRAPAVSLCGWLECLLRILTWRNNSDSPVAVIFCLTAVGERQENTICTSVLRIRLAERTNCSPCRSLATFTRGDKNNLPRTVHRIPGNSSSSTASTHVDRSEFLIRRRLSLN